MRVLDSGPRSPEKCYLINKLLGATSYFINLWLIMHMYTHRYCIGSLLPFYLLM